MKAARSFMAKERGKSSWQGKKNSFLEKKRLHKRENRFTMNTQKYHTN